jgi:hypothetical protein
LYDSCWKLFLTTTQVCEAHNAVFLASSSRGWGMRYMQRKLVILREAALLITYEKEVVKINKVDPGRRLSME